MKDIYHRCTMSLEENEKIHFIMTEKNIHNLAKNIFDRCEKRQIVDRIVKEKEKFIIFEKEKDKQIKTEIVDLEKVLSLKNTDRNIITIAYLDSFYFNAFYPYKSSDEDIYYNNIVNSIKEFIIDINWGINHGYDLRSKNDINHMIEYLEKKEKEKNEK